MSFFLGGLKPGVGTNVMKLASFLAVAELLPLIVSADTATGPGATGFGEAFLFALALVTWNFGGLPLPLVCIKQLSSLSQTKTDWQ